MRRNTVRTTATIQATRKGDMAAMAMASGEANTCRQIVAIFPHHQPQVRDDCQGGRGTKLPVSPATPTTSPAQERASSTGINAVDAITHTLHTARASTRHQPATLHLLHIH